MAGAALALVHGAQAQVLISELDTPVVETFDGIGNAANAAYPTGWQRNSLAALNWNDTGFLTNCTQAAGTTGAGVLSASSSFGWYNFADGVTASSTDRAIGALGSGNANYRNPTHFLLGVQNNTGSTVESLTVDWDYEKYRSGNRAWQWTFFASPDGVSWTPYTAGDQNYPTDGTNSTIFNPPTSIDKSVAISGLGLANGAKYYFRWTLQGVGGASNGMGLGIDNVSVEASSGVVPVLTTDTTTFTPALGIARVGGTTTSSFFTVTATNLTANVEAAAPAGFQVSIDDTTWASSVVVGTPPSVSGAPVYVRFAPSATGAASGDVTVSSTGAASSLVAVSALGAEEPIAISAVNVAYTQDFDGLPSTGSASFVSSVTPIAGWYAARSGGLATQVTANDGASNAGNLYSFGVGPDTDRALGSLGSAATGAVAYGALFKNTTGTTITDLKIAYRGEQWRATTAAAQSVEFYWLTSPTPITTFDNTFAGYNFEANLTYASPIFSVAADTALDGNDPLNQVTLDYTIPGLSIAPGDEFAIKFVDIDHAGADHALAIDGFSLIANPGVGPTFPNGDADADTFVNVADVTAIHNFVAAVTGPVPGDGDYDNDGDVDINDANALVNALVNAP